MYFHFNFLQCLFVNNPLKLKGNCNLKINLIISKMKDLIKKLELKLVDFNPYYDDYMIDIDDLGELLYEIKKLKYWCTNCLKDLNELEKECQYNRRCFVCDPKKVVDKLN